MKNKWSVVQPFMALLLMLMSTLTSAASGIYCSNLFAYQSKSKNLLIENQNIEIVQNLTQLGYPQGMVKRIIKRYPELAAYLASHNEVAGAYRLYRGYRGPWESYLPDFPLNSEHQMLRKTHSWSEYIEKRWRYLRRFRDPKLVNNPSLYTYMSNSITVTQDYANRHARFSRPKNPEPGYILELYIPDLIIGWEPGTAFSETFVLDTKTIPDITPFINRVIIVSPTDDPTVDIKSDDPRWQNYEDIAIFNKNIK